MASLAKAPSSFTRRSFLVSAFVLAALAPLAAQTDEPEQALSNAEIERLRDAAPDPPQRLLLFISFLDKRTGEMEQLQKGPRHPGREDDLHDLMNQFSSISDDLDDNLDDYSQNHKDVRKVLPRLLSATERWATILRTPPDDERYNVARKLALTSLDDVRQTATDLLSSQQARPLAKAPQSA